MKCQWAHTFMRTSAILEHVPRANIELPRDIMLAEQYSFNLALTLRLLVEHVI